jgi:alpha-beta hydrolase superfamily lysophospholipase
VHQRGTGLSEGARGDIEDFGRVIADYSELAVFFRKPWLPVFILGHGFGGALAVQLAVQLKSQLSGVILLNTAHRLKKQHKPSVIELLGYAYNYKKNPSALVIDSVPEPEKVFFLLDRKEAEKRLLDEWVVKKHSIRYMAQVKKIMDSCSRSAKKSTVPLLSICGMEDRFVYGNDEIYRKWGSPSKQRTVIGVAGHGTHIEGYICEDLLPWLKNRLDS